MITFITGLPGNGKTLFALNYVKKYSEKENREVYYHGIKDLLLPWTEFKAEEWFTLPAGSIIVIDEAQFIFPKKPNGSKLPEFYEKLAVHRHSGYDIFIITQHPSLVDNFVRQLAGRHFHCIRKFGLQSCKVWEWQAVNTTPEKASSHKTAVLLKFKYPKEVYGYYKSAEVHTHKRHIPAKLVLAVFFVIGVFALGYWQLDKYQKRFKKDDAPAAVPAGANPQNGSGSTSGAMQVAFDPVADAKAYIYKQTPRITGLVHTAPKYDEVTKPTVAPVPTMCMQMGRKCQCYSQQGTKLPVEFNLCVEIAQNGYFEEFNPNGIHAKAETTPQQNSQVLAKNEEPERPAVRVFDRDGYGILGKTPAKQ